MPDTALGQTRAAEQLSGELGWGLLCRRDGHLRSAGGAPPSRGTRIYVACAFIAIGPRSSLAQTRESKRHELDMVRCVRFCLVARLSENSERLYESDNGVLGGPHRSAAGGRSGAPETEMAQRRIAFLSLMYKKSSDPGNSPTASRRRASRLL